MPQYYRSNQAEVHVSIPGTNLDSESWDMMEGGDPVPEMVEHFPGGEKPQVALGGLPKWTPVTVERGWSESLAVVYKELANNAGGLPVTVSYIQRGPGNQPTGVVASYTGVLGAVERPKYKASESAEAFLKITISVDGSVQ